VATLVVDAGPRETVGAGLSKKVPQKIHFVHQSERDTNAGEVVGSVSVHAAKIFFKLRTGTHAAVTVMHHRWN
jgi:hypothetical protein